MTLNHAVPVGTVKLGCYDDRADSPTQGNVLELFVGELNDALVTIPHDPDEIMRADPCTKDIPYDWALRYG